MNPARNPHPLDPSQILPFLMIFEDLDVHALFEHFAWPINLVHTRIENFRVLGFTEVGDKKLYTNPFLLRGDVQLELVTLETPAHYAYAVETVDDYDYVVGKMLEGKGRTAFFEHLPEYEVRKPHMRADMFRHKDSDVHYQIVCRVEEEIYPTFKPVTGTDQSAEEAEE